jgi:hypothetical protein
MDTDFQFVALPGSLLRQVSAADKNKICICKACALSHKLHSNEPI